MAQPQLRKKPRSNNHSIDRGVNISTEQKEAYYKQSRYFQSQNNEGHFITLNTD